MEGARRMIQPALENETQEYIDEHNSSVDEKEKALKAYDHFINTFNAKYPKAVKILTKDKNNLFTFYDFPAAVDTYQNNKSY